MLEQHFDLTGHGTSVRGELLAGLSTFLTMTTVSSANPAGPAATGMDFGAMFVAILLSLKFALI